MGVVVLRGILSLGLVLFILSLVALVWVPADSPGAVPAALALTANLLTVVGAGLVLRKLSAKKRN
jgi:hypothetical protein